MKKGVNYLTIRIIFGFGLGHWVTRDKEHPIVIHHIIAGCFLIEWIFASQPNDLE